MRFSFSWKRLLLAGLLLLFAKVFHATELPAGPAIPNLPVITKKSGYAFSGTVKAIERVAPKGRDRVAVYRITFQVDQGFRGVRTGQTLVIREWAGLWQAGPRYRRGEHLVLFLYPPSKLGLTSPVGGAQGRFRVNQDGNVIVEPHQTPEKTHEGWRLPTHLLINPRDLARNIRQAEEN